MTNLILHCGYHKCGSVLFGKVLRALCARTGLRFASTNGPHDDSLYETGDVLMFGNSTARLARIRRPWVGTHMIRDPRDVIVSGYLYHLRCDEKWCVNEDLSLDGPISHPRVPFSQMDRTEEWKRAYLESLGGRSYQQNLRALDQDEGIAFEMRHYGRWTIERMLDWDYRQPAMLELKFEDVMADFNGCFARVFAHYGVPREHIPEMLALIQQENLANLDDARIAQDDHIHSRQTSKWRRYLTDGHRALFGELFGDALARLGYADDW